jgi:hypothetical protein
MAYAVEHTDTFGGDANYCWVNRYEIEAHGKTPTGQRISLVRQAKKLCGLTGVRCDVWDCGDMIEIRPRGICQIVFVTWKDE